MLQTSDLDEAWNKVQAALREAEENVQKVDQLPSAHLPRKVNCSASQDW